MDETPFTPVAWQKALFDALDRNQPIIFMPAVNVGKTLAAQQLREHFDRMGSALKRSSDAIQGVRAQFVILDEFDALRDAPRVEALPKKKRDWRAQEQAPPAAVEQKKRGPGVVLMRDRTGKLVERQL